MQITQKQYEGLKSLHKFVTDIVSEKLDISFDENDIRQLASVIIDYEKENPQFPKVSLSEIPYNVIAEYFSRKSDFDVKIGSDGAIVNSFVGITMQKGMEVYEIQANTERKLYFIK